MPEAECQAVLQLDVASMEMLADDLLIKVRISHQGLLTSILPA